MFIALSISSLFLPSSLTQDFTLQWRNSRSFVQSSEKSQILFFIISSVTRFEWVFSTFCVHHDWVFSLCWLFCFLQGKIFYKVVIRQVQGYRIDQCSILGGGESLVLTVITYPLVGEGTPVSSRPCYAIFLGLCPLTYMTVYATFLLFFDFSWLFFFFFDRIPRKILSQMFFLLTISRPRAIRNHTWHFQSLSDIPWIRNQRSVILLLVKHWSRKWSSKNLKFVESTYTLISNGQR